MRRPELWALYRSATIDPRFLYRLHLVPEGEAVRQNFGDVLSRERCLGPDGATSAADPGALTRWLGIPSQTDEASYNSSADYAPSTYLSVPSYWAARFPEQVLSAAAFERAGQPVGGQPGGGVTQRLKQAFMRDDWLRDVRGRAYAERIGNMIEGWAGLGVVEPVPTSRVLMDAGFPPLSHVETGRDGAAAGTGSEARHAGRGRVARRRGGGRGFGALHAAAADVQAR